MGVDQPVGCHLGVPDRMLDVLVPEVMLQSPCVVAIIGELKITGMAQHVWVDWEWHLGSLADALDEPVETNRSDLLPLQVADLRGPQTVPIGDQDLASRWP